MELTYLLIMFAVVVAAIWLKQPLYVAMLASVLTGVLLFRVPLGQLGGILLRGTFGRDTLMMVSAFYTITYLQRMLEKRGRLLEAEHALSVLSGNKRLNIMITPFIVGLMPSIGAVLIAAPIVDKIAGDELDVPERAFVSSFYRHISEAFLPTYAHILMALQLSGNQPLRFVLYMLPMVGVLFALGYVFYVRKISKDKDIATTKAQRKTALKQLFVSMWTVLVVVMMMMVLRLPVFVIVLGVVLVNALLERFTWKELGAFVVKAFETKLIFNTIVIMIFKEVLVYSGALMKMPEYFSHLPIPTHLVYALMMLVGTVIAGSQAMIAMLIPIAFAAAQAGMPLLVLLMSMAYIAMQVSPTHVCLSVVVEYYKMPLVGLIKKTIPVVLAAMAVSVAYYYLLLLIG